MKIDAIIAQENKYPTTIFLYKEGIFWKLYNQSALWWVANIKPLKQKVTYIKYLKKDVLSVGFPVSSFKNYEAILNASQYKAQHISDSQMQVINIEKVGVEKCTKLIGQLVIEERRKGNQSKEEDDKLLCHKEQVVLAIKNFPLASKTPFEAMAFLVKLQQKINISNG